MENEINKLKKNVAKLSNQNKYLSNELNLVKQLLLKKNMDSIELEHYCPICGELSIFEPFGVHPRMNVRCPKCGSLERHRLVYLFFQLNYSYLLENEEINLLHFAPETVFYNYFKQKDNINYHTVDLYPETYESRNIHITQKVDMQNIPYPDKNFDFIYNCHVLEHVPNDIKGMEELYRVLKDDGVCITLVPQSNIETTLENEDFNTPELRKKYYGQEDHLRKYGLDFKNRLESVGFNVNEIRAEDIIKSESEKELYNLINDVIYVCTK